MKWRTILLFLGIILIMVLGLSFKNRWFPFNYSAKYQPSKWDSILIGKWKLTERHKGEYLWVFNSEIQFFDTHEFELSVTDNAYNPEVYGKDTKLITVGGFTKGKWHVFDDKTIMLHDLFDCDIKVGYIIQEYFSHLAFGCEFYEGRQYGTAQEGDYKSEIKEFSNSSIVIVGKVYSSETEITITFTKM